MLFFLFLLFLFSIGAAAQSIAPATPPEIEGAVKILPPPPAPTAEIEPRKDDAGFFRQNLDAEISGAYLFNRGQRGLLGILAGGANVIIADANHLGEKIGLAEDALEYKLGLGGLLGYDVNDQPLFSIPLSAGAALYLKEGSLWGFDPFIGAGLNLNLIGTDFRLGGIGFQLYGGILIDLGWLKRKTALLIGYNSYRVEGSRLAEGIFISLSQPLKL